MTARRTASWLAWGVAAGLAAAALLADFLSPRPPEAQDLERFFAPPTRIRFFDASGAFHLRPFVYRYELVDTLDVKYEENKNESYPVRLFAEGYRYRLLGLVPASVHLALTEGQPLHPFGTDELGRDVLARILAGARTSLLVVIVGTGLYALLGLVVGCAAGVLGGWADSALMRLSEFVLALPALYLILALRALLPARLGFWQTLLVTTGTIAAVSWPPLARGVRGLVLQLRSAAHVEAARALGSPPARIVREHILPALSSFTCAQASVAAPVFLLGEVVLSFLDVGFRDSGTSWGLMLRNLKDPRVLTDFWWNLSPLACVFATLLCMNLLGAETSEKQDG